MINSGKPQAGEEAEKLVFHLFSTAIAVFLKLRNDNVAKLCITHLIATGKNPKQDVFQKFISAGQIFGYKHSELSPDLLSWAAAPELLRVPPGRHATVLQALNLPLCTWRASLMLTCEKGMLLAEMC